MQLKSGNSRKVISNNIHEMAAAGPHEANYAEGGEVERDEDDELMDHVAMEAVNAVHAKDHEGFRNAFHVLVAHTLSQLGESEGVE
jgi:hypothetical protein